MNRGIKRLARMTGREAPSDLELRENLRKRMYIPSGGRRPLGGKREELEKRFNRPGTGLSTASTPANQANSLAAADTGASSDDITLTLGDIISALTSLANGNGNRNASQRNNRHRSESAL